MLQLTTSRYQPVFTPSGLALCSVLLLNIISCTTATATTLQEYPILDAMIASAHTLGSATLSDMVAASTCGNEQYKEENQENSPNADFSQMSETLERDVAEIVKTSLKHSDIDRGRIVEHTKEWHELGENYRAVVHGVTLSCFTTFDGLEDGNSNNGGSVGPAAYASHMVFSSQDALETSDADDATKHNVSMLVEADIMELPNKGMVYVPKRHCLDFLPPNTQKDENKEEDSVNKGGDDTEAFFAKIIRRRAVSLGTKVATITSSANRMAWLFPNQGSSSSSSSSSTTTTNALDVSSAYRTPKMELIGMEQAYQANCHTASLSGTSTNASSENVNELCVSWAMGLLDSQGIAYNTNALQTAAEQYAFMNAQWETAGQSTQTPMPLLFDSSIATPLKNTDGMGSTMKGNYYLSPEEFQARINALQATNNTGGELSLECLLAKQSNSTSGQRADATTARALASVFPAALQRRLAEVHLTPDKATSPKSSLSEWSFPLSNASSLLSLNEPYVSNQKLEFETNADGSFTLSEKNLTNQRLGRTASYLLLSPSFSSSSSMGQLLQSTAESATIAYSHAGSQAASPDYPCAGVASNTEIYLLVFGVVVAACGGVGQFLESFHSFLRFLASYALEFAWFCNCARGCGSGSAHGKGSDVLSWWQRLLPTYEMFIVTLGTVVFGSVYFPVYLQYENELGISEFETHAVDVDVRYASTTDNNNNNGNAATSGEGGAPLLVTLTYVETKCTEARPQLLYWLFVFGLLFGILINIPYIRRVLGALHRYWLRLVEGQRHMPYGTSIMDEQLLLFSPACHGPRDVDPGVGTREDAGLGALSAMGSDPLEVETGVQDAEWQDVVESQNRQQKKWDGSSDDGARRRVPHGGGGGDAEPMTRNTSSESGGSLSSSKKDARTKRKKTRVKLRPQRSGPAAESLS